MENPFNSEPRPVPPVGRHRLVLVDGRTFAISDEDGEMVGSAHGLVHDDLRHLSRFSLDVHEAGIDVLSSSTPTPLSAIVVGRIGHGDDAESRAVITRRRWVAGGLREDVHVYNTSPSKQHWTVRAQLASDFAHLFDVKAGLDGIEQGLVADNRGNWSIQSPDSDASTLVEVLPKPDSVDLTTGTLIWTVAVEPKEQTVISITVEPKVDGNRAGLAFPLGTVPSDAVPMRRLVSWRARVPEVVSTDPRLSRVLDQALADIAALRIIDAAHVERSLVAAGAPWFMTVFGRDSLLTAWMTLPFDPGLAVGVLSTLAELQGVRDDPLSDEAPGKIIHELRRQGGGGPFSQRSRYYGTVDATPLFVMLAAEACRWGALNEPTIEKLQTAVDAALGWLIRSMDSDDRGFLSYQRSDPAGLANQGWKDSWDGINFADGSMPRGPIALVEAQGYAYRALCDAAELAKFIPLSRSVDQFNERAEALRQRFNETFWDKRGWFVIGLDGDGRPIDSLTTNPGHALWAGIADDDFADEYLDRLLEPTMWTGWGLRTLADRMTAYDPLSYHNGSVWPHDTALCAAGAARYNRWDVVDRLLDGALDAANEFDGRPPELFAGIDRADAPTPVSYPSSCSPQAWSSASILLHLRTMLDLGPDESANSLRVHRHDLGPVPNLKLERIQYAADQITVEVIDHKARITTERRIEN